MGIVLAGVPLVIPNREIITDIERDISIDKMLLMFSRAWPGPGTGFLAMPTHYRRWPPWNKPGSILNRLYWPTGASRFGIGCFLATKKNCDDIHDACFGADGTQTNKVKLVLSCNNLGSAALAGQELIEYVECEGMTVFPPIPLYRITNNDGSTDFGGYMLICVDPRYYWWNIPCPDLGISEASPGTWESIISKLGNEINKDIGMAGVIIPEAYLAPHRALNLTNEPLPMVLDAIMYNIGARFICNFDGDVFIQRFDGAIQYYKTESEVEVVQVRQVRAGDNRYVDLY